MSAPTKLIVLDMGDLRTRALARSLPSGEAAGTLELESAVALLEGGPSLLPAYAGMEGGPETDPVPPVLDAETSASLAVGAAAADVTGYAAYLAAGADARKIEAIVRSVLFALAEPGERVELLLVADPGAKADRLRELSDRLGAEGEVSVTTLDPTAGSGMGGDGERETRTFAVLPRVLDAGPALLEVAFERGILEPDGAPAFILDMGHRTTRAYLVDAEQGVVDLEVVPHGGQSYLEHARRVAAESRDRGRDVSLLRQLARGTDLLQFGAMTRVTRKFFEDARRELSKAVAGAVASRLRRHLERGARWPQGLIIAGGLAIPDGGEVLSELRARGCAFQKVRTLPRSPSPLLEGALLLRERLGT